MSHQEFELPVSPHHVSYLLFQVSLYVVNGPRFSYLVWWHGSISVLIPVYLNDKSPFLILVIPECSYCTLCPVFFELFHNAVNTSSVFHVIQQYQAGVMQFKEFTQTFLDPPIIAF